MQEGWPKKFTELPNLIGRYSLTFMLVNTGNGFTHHVSRYFKNLTVDNACLNPALRAFLLDTNPEVAVISIDTFNSLFPKAFFVRFGDRFVVSDHNHKVRTNFL